ncbi:MAG: response regulator [Myxococcales bacterium]|nr:response regulator [Myxococcales bacterium]
MKVLVVDDSRAMRRIMRQAIEFADVEANVLEAEHGQQALEVVHAESPDLVLSDVNMPVMGGDAFLDAMRAEGRLEKTRVVMVTSAVGAVAALDLVRRGALKVVRKPFDPLTLHAQLGEFLDPPPPPEPPGTLETEDGPSAEASGDEPVSAVHQIEERLIDEALEATSRVLEQSLAEQTTIDEAPAPRDSILLAATLDVNDPISLGLTLLASYDVASRLAVDLMGERPEDDRALLDAFGEILNIVAGDFVDAIGTNGVAPGMFGLPRTTVISPDECPDEIWGRARLIDPEGDLWIRVAVRSGESE